MLIITPLPASHLAPGDTAQPHSHRFECRTCPYQMVLDRRYYERKDMQLKAAEDVLGGTESWKNVDKTDGKCFPPNAVGVQHGARHML